MKNKLNLSLVLIIVLSILKLSWAQHESPLQRARQQLIENEKNRFWSQQDYHQNISRANQNLFNVSYYGLNLNIDPVTREISGKVTIQGMSLTTGLNQLEIDLLANLVVDSVRQGSASLSFSHIQDLMEILLQHSLNNGDAFDITVTYHGNPEENNLGVYGWDYHGIQNSPIIWTLSEPYGAPAWWPCKDDPADKADSVFITITVPNGLVAVSNGLLTSVTYPDAAHTTWSWRTYYPISTYLVSLAISNYASFTDWYVTATNDSMPVEYYVYPEHLSNAREDLNITVEMISCFSGLFGEYPFLKEKYGMVIFPWGGAMEHQTITSYGAGLITGNHFFDFINAHELAHQWFGDCITMRSWSHIWLNEGFASYAEALWEEYLGGKDAYLAYMRTQERPNFAGSLFVADTTDINALFSSTVYDKGSWVLHMLRGVMGDSLFLASLKTYATHPNFTYSNALTEDFRDICETVSGQDLNWFFEEWVYRPGKPDYKVIWQTIGSGPYRIKAKIVQNNSELYIMPLEIRFQGSGQDTLLHLWNNQRSQEYTIHTTFLPETLALDPDGWILKQVQITYLGNFPQEIPEKFSISQNFPNPFNINTQIRIELPHDAEVTIEIFNLLGQSVYNIKIGFAAGYQTWPWDGKDRKGNGLPTGLYFYQISYKADTQVRKMVLVK